MAGDGACPAAARAASRSPRRQQPADTGPPIVVFVHGNGDSSALWINNIWRFEANGYKRNQLFAIDFAYPNARREDAKPELFRSSAEEQMKELAALRAAGAEGCGPAQGGAGRLLARRQRHPLAT